ncbi:MAG: efflux RND transporter periplasmic adaptor subunit [Psychrobacter sp.]|uniref:efflux RND transporter periplasmic adaptor subunit n=1 Tax=unclassified Psychrobacter TaxID=196806 RepID=UPI001787E52B|nr:MULTISPECIES: efflux RND transporter periplasmic adaptor subunit [unclassified Psychrobacter]MBE0442024.1 efflux RND transporter periplasmic adaptor subunit [Psychrobacter sp. FME13]
MNDLSDHNDKPSLANDEQPLANNPLPPYRQTEATNKPTSKIPLWLWPVVAVVLLIGVLLGRYWNTSNVAADESAATTAEQASTESDAANEEQAVLSVETITPSQDNVGNTLRADGTINAKDMANVSAKVTGVAIERILVEEGDRVKAGQVLAVFDTDAMEQQVLQAQADVAEAEATLANASADAARILPLLDIDAISKQEADRYRTAELRAKAVLQSSKARLSSQRLSVENARVVAPVSGVISEKTVEVGMVAGGEPLFTIIKGGILEWRADIDPKLIGEVSVGTPVRVSLPGGNSVMGEVSRIAPTADDNRQITIYASLETSAQVRAGMYQTGEFLLGSASTQTVPNSAIVSNDGYDYVMLITDVNTKDGKSTGRVQQQRVTLGERLGDRVAVTEPLPSDGQMVKQGGSFLNDGDLVNIVNDAASKKSATGSAEQARS